MSGHVYNVWNTDDVDYFQVSCSAEKKLQVKLTIEGGAKLYHRWVVDGTEGPTPWPIGSSIDRESHATITVDPRAKHTIMVTGDAANYRIEASPTQ
jgi:hypothetical protein